MEKISILLVDDMNKVDDQVRRFFELRGIEAFIDFKQPKADSFPFGCNFPLPEELDKYDLALIDLELDYAHRSGLQYLPEDLGGGTQILPFLRSHAPWLPAIAYSRLFVNLENHFIAVAGSFGFDGHIFRDSFDANTFDRNLFDTLMDHAWALRRSACMGCIPNGKDVAPEIKVGLMVSSKLTRDLGNEQWREALQLAFWFARAVTVERATSGLSGSTTLKCFVELREQGNIEEGTWFTKLNRSPSKLHKEINAHRQMMRKGLDHARIVPPLWPDVLFHKGVAIVAYQFAKDTEPFSTHIMALDKVGPALTSIKSVFAEFYNRRTPQRDIIINLLRAQFPKKEQFAEARRLLPGSQLIELLNALSEEVVLQDAEKSVSYDSCMIHGDLHCDNIMTGKSVLLIDFAHSRVGPIAYDLAKLFCDIMFRVNEYHNTTFIGFDTPGPIQPLCKHLLKVFQFHESEIHLINLFIMLELARSLSYAQLSGEIKQWIQQSLSTIDSSSFIKGVVA